jgi:hypothetical protein
MTTDKTLSCSHAETTKRKTVAEPPPSGATQYRKLSGIIHDTNEAASEPDKTRGPITTPLFVEKAKTKTKVLNAMPSTHAVIRRGSVVIKSEA